MDFYQILTENSQDIIMLWSIEGEILYENQATEKILGYKQGTRKNLKILDYVHPKDRKTISRKLLKLKKKPHKSRKFEFRAKHKKGTYLWLEAKCRNISGQTELNGILININVLSQSETLEKQFEKQNIQSFDDATKYAYFFNHIHDAIFIYNPDNNKIIDANKATTDIYGYSKEELIGMSCLQFSAEVKQSEKVAEEIKVKGKAHVSRRNHRSKDGKELYVYLSCHQISLHGKNYVMTISQDHTLQTLAKKAKKEQELEYQHIIKNIPGMVAKYKLNPDGTDQLLFLSKQVEELFEIPHQKAIKNAQLMWDPIHKDDLDSFRDSILKSRKKLTVWDSEFRIVMPDGRIKWIHARGIPFKTEDKSVAWDSVCLEITHRKNIEQALAENEAKLKSVVENSSNVFYRHDTKHKINYLSPQIEEILGYRIDEAMVKWTALTSDNPANRKGYDLTVKALKTGEKQLPYEMELVHKKGHKVWTEIREVPLVEEGKVIGMVGALIDITDRKKAEETLKTSEEKYRELNRTKDVFFSIISHDLRSPFGGIMGLSTLAIERLKQKNYKDVKSFCEQIYRTSDLSIKLLDNILYWSRLQTGTLVFKPNNFLIKNTIENILLLLQLSIDEKHIFTKVDADSELAVFADIFMTETILRNLLSNAVKYTQEEGAISIYVTRQKDEVIIQVKDSGIGIYPARMEKLFDLEKFESTAGTKNEKGTGLGLILCHQLIKKQGGRIWAESEINKGSSFYFTLKAASSDQLQK